MKVRLLIGYEACYACINGGSFTMDVRLKPGRSPQRSLRESAIELIAEADRLLERAQRMRSAAEHLDAQGEQGQAPAPSHPGDRDATHI